MKYSIKPGEPWTEREALKLLQWVTPRSGILSHDSHVESAPTQHIARLLLLNLWKIQNLHWFLIPSLSTVFSSRFLQTAYACHLSSSAKTNWEWVRVCAERHRLRLKVKSRKEAKGWALGKAALSLLIGGRFVSLQASPSLCGSSFHIIYLSLMKK